MISVSQSLVQDLEQQQQSMMMKKLLFAVCRNYWENDRTKLLSTETEDLVSELRHSQPNLTAVSTQVQKVVSRLNKREKYYPIARKLMAKISKLYGEVIDESQTCFDPIEIPAISMSVPLTESSKILAIVQEFEQDRNAQRIHKMLFALVQQRWENNPETLSNYPLNKLVKDIHEKYPDLERVALSLLKIVKGLNKQGTYSKVAQGIITQLAKLYNDGADVQRLKSLVNLSKQTLSQAKATQSYVNLQSKVQTETRKHNFDYNPYQVRQRVMKYTNPLRVKMLLFYTLNPNHINGTKEGDDGLLLKTYELDKMLMEVVQKFKTVKELQDNLETTALGISSIKNKMFNVEENLQVAKGIVMSLKPLYEKD